MEENPIISMAKAGRIIRKSIHTFLKNYQHFTSITAFIVLPFSISVLISQALSPRSYALLPAIHGRLLALFEAARFPLSSDLISLLSLKLSQTVSSSIITLPFTISFLLLAKASIIHSLNRSTKKPQSFISLYTPLLSTYLCNSFIIFSVNASCFSLVFFAFAFLESLQIESSKWVMLLSAIGAVFYSIVLANALVVCNLALVCSGIEGLKKRQRGFTAILRACILIRGKSMTALALALVTNFSLAAIEVLFHFRILSSLKSLSFSPLDNTEMNLWLVITIEGVFIAYIYSIFLVLDVIMSCLFYQSCKERHEEDYYNDRMEMKLKELEEFV